MNQSTLEWIVQQGLSSESIIETQIRRTTLKATDTKLTKD